MTKLTFLGIAAAGLLAGCATLQQQPQAAAYDMGVNAVASAPADRALAYKVMPGAESQEGDPEFRRIAEQVTRALKLARFTVAEENQAPDVAVFVEYGIGEPRLPKEAFAAPLLRLFDRNRGEVVEHTGDSRPWDDPGTVRDRFIIVRAFDLKGYQRNGIVNQLWETRVLSSGAAPTFDELAPYMLAVAASRFARSTGGPEVLYVAENSNMASFIRDGGERPPPNL